MKRNYGGRARNGRGDILWKLDVSIQCGWLDRQALDNFQAAKPAQNARKWFAIVEIERMSQDPAWLNKAIRIVEKQIQEMNLKQRGKEQSPMPLVR